MDVLKAWNNNFNVSEKKNIGYCFFKVKLPVLYQLRWLIQGMICYEIQYFSVVLTTKMLLYIFGWGKYC